MYIRAFLALAACFAVAEAALGQRPLDPLTAAERARADQVLRGDTSSRRLFVLPGSRTVLTGAELLSIKGSADGRITANDSALEQRGLAMNARRAAELTYYVYGPQEFGVRAFVDLSTNRVLRVERVPDGRVPLGPEEIAEARRLALADRRVQGLLGTSRDRVQTEWLGLHSESSDDPCNRNRCVQILFRRGDQYLMGSVIVVNLSTRTVDIQQSLR